MRLNADQDPESEIVKVCILNEKGRYEISVVLESCEISLQEVFSEWFEDDSTDD